MSRYRRRILLSVAVVASVAALLALAFRRADITDPAVLASMPLSDLRDVEVETLIRAAFRDAEQVTLYTGVKVSETEFPKPTVITDRATLDELADCFSAGSDDERLPRYVHPGITYTKVEFLGPYAPDFTFADDQRIYIFKGRDVYVRTAFAKKLADLMSLPIRGENP